MHQDDTRIYQRALELVSLSKQVMDGLPNGYGKSSLREQRRYFGIARGSAHEVATILDVALRFEVVDPELHERGKDICDHLAAMLTRFR